MSIHRSLRIGVLVFLVLALFASFSVASAQDELTGSAVFRDSAALSDSLVVSLGNVPAPAADKEYEGWLLSDDQKTKISTGILRVNGGAIDTTYVSPTKANLAATYSVFAITVEPKPDTSPDPSGVFAYSDTIVAGAMTHVRHEVVAFASNPSQKGISVGLREQARLARTHADLAFNSTTLAGLKEHAEHVVNIIEGSTGKNFGDLDKSGVAANPGDGKGVLLYAADARTHGALAKSAAPADKTVGKFGDNVIASADNVTAWATQGRDRALEALQATDLTLARIFIENARSVLAWTAEGRDADGSGAVDPVAGEAGAVTVYLEAQNIASFEPVKGAPAPPTPPKVGEPVIPALALIVLLGGLVLTSMGSAILLWRRRMVA